MSFPASAGFGEPMVPLSWRCLECDREWTTIAIADVCCPHCGAEGAASTLDRPVRGPQT